MWQLIKKAQFVGITANASRYNEFMSAFETIAPVTFYYENSPYAEAITEEIRQKYLNDNNEAALKNGILEVSFYIHLSLKKCFNYCILF